MGMWQIEMEPIKDWLDGLDKQTAYQVYAALDLLRECGPNLKRPLVGKIEGSIIGSMKELRPGSTGRSEVRILFVFDPERKAVYWSAETNRTNGTNGIRQPSAKPNDGTSGGWKNNMGRTRNELHVGGLQGRSRP